MWPPKLYIFYLCIYSCNYYFIEDDDIIKDINLKIMIFILNKEQKLHKILYRQIKKYVTLLLYYTDRKSNICNYKYGQV